MVGSHSLQLQGLGRLGAEATDAGAAEIKTVASKPSFARTSQ